MAHRHLRSSHARCAGMLTLQRARSSAILTRTQSTLFDVRAKSVQKARAASQHDAERYEYLRDHMATELVDRLHDISRTFPSALDLFCGNAHILRALKAHGGSGKIQRLYQTDVHDAVVQRARAHADGKLARREDAFVFQEGQALRIDDESLHAVLSGGALHWVNDLPAMLATVRQKLRPDGVFLGALLGGDTLQELRISLQQAEDQLLHRAAARTSPTVHVRDAARLLSSAQLTLPAADVERLVVSYKDMWSVMRHLRAMGEGNALRGRHHWAGRRLFERAAHIYKQRFGSADGDGVEATFELIYVIGWKASPTQRRAAARGSATLSLSQLGAAKRPRTARDDE